MAVPGDLFISVVWRSLFCLERKPENRAAQALTKAIQARGKAIKHSQTLALQQAAERRYGESHH